jgi:RNA polymerase sigma factor (sigma-70 family)
VTAADQNRLVADFEEHRGRLRAIAYRMLGSLSEAEDAVQEAWLRLSRSDAAEIENLSGWLTTVVARLCLNMLRTRATRREESLDLRLPDPIVSREDALTPEQQVLQADAVGLAMLVVLDKLTPAERVAYVLHDLFAVPFEEIAVIAGRTPAATRQLASRARRRVQQEAPAPDVDLSRQRQVVDAFFAAAHRGDLAALLAVLDPDIVLRSDGGTKVPQATAIVQGAEAVASRALSFAHLHPYARPIVINGIAGVLVAPQGRPFSVMAFTVVANRIVAIDALADPDRLAALDLPAFED